MQRIAFKMRLIKGNESEYKRRHEALWPELQSLLQSKGIKEYSIFLEQDTGELFGVLKIADTLRLDELPAEPIMKKWWAYMKDLMDCHIDHSPVSIPLQEVFYMP